jgi:two-component system, cell cycle sensor histidine kinase and response regulator CckA
MGSESSNKRTSVVVLLADDELIVRSLARSILVSAGYKVLDAKDGEAALEVSRGYPGSIDVLLTDVKMPKMNGLELSAQVTVERPGIKILFMSGKTSGDLIFHGQKIDFLRKPFEPETLCDRIDSLLTPTK